MRRRRIGLTRPSTVLEELRVALAKAKQGTSLTLDGATLGTTGAKALLDIFATLQISAFTMDDVALPATVTGDTLLVSGTGQGVTLGLSFEDVLGEVAVRSLFQAPDVGALGKLCPGLPAGFFSGIDVIGKRVAIPGLTVLQFASPSYGVMGAAIPNGGFMTKWVAPRVDGDVALPDGAKGIFVELETASSGYHVAPLTDTWGFADVAGLVSGLGILAAFPSIIPTGDLGLESFDLNLYPQLPGLSSLWLDVADTADPSKPLWSVDDGKVALTDVAVTLALQFSDTTTLALAGSGWVQGNFKLGSLVLEAEIPFPLDGVWSLTAFPNLTLEGALDDLAVLLAPGSNFADLLPAKLSDILDEVEFTYLRIAIDAKTFSLVEFSFAFGTVNKWPLVPGSLELGSLSIHLTVAGKAGVYGSIFGKIELPPSEIVVRFGRGTSAEQWRLDVVSPAIALPTLANLAPISQGADVGSLVKAGGLDQGGIHPLHFLITGLNFGLVFGPAQLTNLGLTLQLADADDPLSPSLDWELIPGELTLTRFMFGFQLDFATKDYTAFGGFSLNGLDFDVRFAEATRLGANTDALVGEYYAEGEAGKIAVGPLLNSISPKLAELVPDGLEVDVNDAILVYLNRADAKQKKYLFAIDVSLEFPLSDLPLIGKSLPADAMAGIKKMKVMVASAALTADDVSFINLISPHAVLPVPQVSTAGGDAIPQGFSVIAELELGAATVLVTSPPPPKKVTAPPVALGTTSVAGTDLATPSSASSSVMWIDVQKSFGPVSIQKVGFSYQDSALFVVSNMSLATGALEIDLLGIGIGSPLTHPEPKFTIQGLDVSFVAGPVSVMGGMLGTIDPTVDFTGALSIHAPEVTLAALAGYALYQDHPSFFLYGILDIPLGGPPAFFIKGIAAGLGFNRKLIIPDVSGVAAFPLVNWAVGNDAPTMDPKQPIGGQVENVLVKLAQSGVVAPSVGDYWFAAGIRFTSFELIDSFALLILTVGADVEIALLGLSTLTVPPDVDEPIAEVQLALEVSFSTGTGLLAIAAQLTSNSYILSKDCRLTGGFAFYLWFKAPHAGETVLSLGGYNPHFTVPDYYPAVPRLGFIWKVSTVVNITGEMYFTVSSNAIMAGGKLSLVFDTGVIRAWFIVWADFLITFNPFHYYLDGGIDLGVSLTIDFGLFTLSLTLHLGVDLALWGPQFAGRAIVDLWIISFTIEFGAYGVDAQTNVTIQWLDFIETLPKAPASTSQRALGAAASSDDEPNLVQINVIAGLVRVLPSQDDKPTYLVTAETFQCAVQTFIPNKEVHYLGTHWGVLDDSPFEADFGVGPVGLASADFSPALTLTITASEGTSKLSASHRLTNAPRALWEKKTFDANGVPQIDPQTGLTNATIPSALVGLTLTPMVDPADVTLPIPLVSLEFSDEGADRQFGWSQGIAPADAVFTKQQTVANTIADTVVAGVRDALLEALGPLGVLLAPAGTPVEALVDVSGIAGSLQAAPRSHLLGAA